MQVPGLLLLLELMFLFDHMFRRTVLSILSIHTILSLYLPVLAGACTILLTDQNNTSSSIFFSSRWGRPYSLSTLILIFCTPEVCILILPGFGIKSHIISQESGKEETFGSKFLLLVVHKTSGVGISRRRTALICSLPLLWRVVNWSSGENVVIFSHRLLAGRPHQFWTYSCWSNCWFGNTHLFGIIQCIVLCQGAVFWSSWVLMCLLL